MQQRLLPIGHVAGVRNQRIVEGMIVVRTTGKDPRFGVAQRAGQPRQIGEADTEAHAAGLCHLGCVADQPEAGDICGRAHARSLRSLRCYPV